MHAGVVRHLESGVLVEAHKPVIVTDGGPWAEHDQLCAVCSEHKAVLDVATGIFFPCDPCFTAGWRLTRKV